MINVEAEVSKYKNCRDRDELGRLIKGYKSLALKNASNLSAAGQYSLVAQKLQEMCDRLPAPQLVKYPTGGARSVKTATLSNEEQAQINAAWEKKTKN